MQRAPGRGVGQQHVVARNAPARLPSGRPRGPRRDRLPVPAIGTDERVLPRRELQRRAAILARVAVFGGGRRHAASGSGSALRRLRRRLRQGRRQHGEELRQRLSRMGTIDLRVDYLRPGRGERFTATSSLLRAGNKVAVARVELHNEEQVYIASATATYMVG